MIERPLLFSSEMVLAIQDGSKTVTRRVITPANSIDYEPLGEFACRAHPASRNRAYVIAGVDDVGVRRVVSRVQPGDALWVKETFRAAAVGADGHCGYRYAADGASCDIKNTALARKLWRADYAGGKWGEQWRPSIYMRRVACRHVLPVRDVWSERLQNITPEQAIAEGIEAHDDEGVTYYGPLDKGHIDPRVAFRELWDGQYGKKAGCSWGENPWVWVYDFGGTETMSREVDDHCLYHCEAPALALAAARYWAAQKGHSRDKP